MKPPALARRGSLGYHAVVTRWLTIFIWLLCGCGSADRGADADVPPDLSVDARPEPDGPWSCTGPAMAGGTVACSFTWQCPDGERKLACTYDVVDNIYDCECQDLAHGKVDGTLTGPPQTCATPVAGLIPEINKACGWKLAP